MQTKIKKRTVVKKKATKKTATYLREIEIHYRKKKVISKTAVGKQIKGAQQVAALFADLQNEAKEKLITISLDTRQKIICFEIVSLGSLNTVYARPAELVRASIMVNAYGVIIIHNHPSGDPKPSKHDTNLTTKLLRVCDDLGIEFQDHIIIGDNSYYSFAEQGLL